MGAASEAYNGAVYELDQVQGRIKQNRADQVTTKKNLDKSRAILGERLRKLYTTPDPTLAEVLVSSGSITEAADQLDLLDRVGQQDASVVDGLKANQDRLKDLEVQLKKDEQTAEDQVAARAAQKQRVEALLAQRQQVLDNTKGELRQLIQEEQQRQAAAAAAARRTAAAQAAALQQNTAGAPAATSAPESSSPAAEPAAQSAPALPSGSGNAAAASAAMSQLGVPYVWGGASPSGFDCSGLASWAYAQIGKSVPHYTGAIWAAFPKVPSDQLQVGDLVFFNGLSHMGIYIGGGSFVHAPHTGDFVKVSSLSGYYSSSYVGAVRP
ncbi:MAG: NlpC/P60 family protein [Thermoleophilia bacterium]